MTPTPKGGPDPQLEAIFTSMQTYMGTEYVSMNCTVSFDGGGVRNMVTCTQPNGLDNWQYTEYVTGTRVSVTPSSASLGPGQTQQFTATAVDASGNPVPTPAFTWSLQPGALGTISSSGLYTAPATIAATTFDTVRCTLNGSNAWATLTVNLRTS